MNRNEFYVALDKSKSLKHFGRLGQKWGTKHSRYPLAPSDFTSKEQSAGGQVYPSNELRISDSEKRKYAKDVQKAAQNAAGEIRYDERKKIVRSGRIFNEGVKKITAEIGDQKNDADEHADNLIGDYIHNSKIRDKYCAIAGIASGIEFSNPNPTIRDIADSAWFYIYEDGDQGFGNSGSVYLYDTYGNNPEKISEVKQLYQQYRNINQYIDKSSSEYIISTLGEIGELPISKFNNKWTVNKYLTMELGAESSSKSSRDKDRMNSYYVMDLLDGYDNMASNAQYTDTIQYAKDIVSKLPSTSESSSGWDNLNKAVELLGMSDTKTDDLTSADWDKINAKVRELNKTSHTFEY